MKHAKVNPPEREETVGFPEDEEISWRQYFVDWRATVWPMFEAQGFTFVEAITFWRQEILLGYVQKIAETLTAE